MTSPQPQKPRQLPYMILYELASDNPKTQGFIRLKSKTQAFDFLTKLAIYIGEREDKDKDKDKEIKEQITLKDIVRNLGKICELRIYVCLSRIQMREQLGFGEEYCDYMVDMAQKVEDYLEAFQDNVRDEGFLKDQVMKITKGRAWRNQQAIQQQKPVQIIENP